MTSEIGALALGIVLFGGLVHGTLGLGFPLVATPLLALVLDVREAILFTLLPTAVLNVASIVRGGGWNDTLARFWPLAACALAGSAVGSRVLVTSDPRAFDLALAALIALYLFASRREPLSTSKPSTHPRFAMLGFGLAAGFAAGTTNVMAPILIVYTLEMKLDRTAMVQVFNLTFLAGKLAQIAVFGMEGDLTARVLAPSVLLAAAALAALTFGGRIRDRMSVETYRGVIRVVLGALAVMLVGRYALG